ncbi:MAG: hypothetical protein PHC61_14105, partial [Chitinivibrionales bacterium]|nr:hypothetical protein [Chitinivibrionales bacterium]
MHSSSRRNFLHCAAGLSAAACVPGASFAAKSRTAAAHPARFWHSFGEMTACDLCPHLCIIDDRKIGLCRTRQNVNGQLVTIAYANPCTIN